MSSENLVTRGNAKLGPDVYLTNLPAVSGCDWRTFLCSLGCYANRGRSRPLQSRYGRNLEILQTDPRGYERTLVREISELRPRVFRFHVSGELQSVRHARMVLRIVRRFPETRFFLYTRSWKDSRILEELRRVDSEPNAFVWFSTDASETVPLPSGRIARIFADEESLRSAGYAYCPEQSGRRESCSDCQLCWTAKPNAKLGFVVHSVPNEIRETFSRLEKGSSDESSS